MSGIGIGISPVFQRDPGLSASEISAIIAIINSLTGLSDTTYQSALSHLVIQHGGTGSGTILELLNEWKFIVDNGPFFDSSLITIDSDNYEFSKNQ